MLRTGLSALLLCTATLQLPQTALAASCTLAKVADLHVTVSPSNRILVDGSIKGQPAEFQIDTGSYATIFDVAVFSRFDISTAGDQRRVMGIGGEVGAVSRTIPDLKFGNFAGDNLHWVILESHFLPDGTYGLLGVDFLSSFDLDIDLAHNAIGLFQHNSCPTEPVYWSQSFSEADLIVRNNKAYVVLELNGTPVEAVFDTGASRTYISTTFTRRIGLDETSPGMTKAGTTTGIDGHPHDVYTYHFAELHVGDEVIKNPLLFVEKRNVLKADTRQLHGLQTEHDTRPEVLLGADFIKTHHIYLAVKDRKMYFTYNGGGVFSPPKDNSILVPEDQ
jgi:predicted aspartyl protease